MTKNIFFFSSTFENGYNGPTKFLRILCEANNQEKYSYKIKVITPDATTSNQLIILTKPLFTKGLLGVLFLNLSFFYQALKIRQTEKNSVFIFNNTIQGILTSIFLRNCFGFINDYSSIEFNKRTSYYLKSRHLVFFILEFIGTHSYDTIISNSIFLKKKICSTYKISENKVKVLYKTFGIDYLNNKKASYEINTNYPTIITFVKSDYIRGGLLDLLNSFRHLSYNEYEVNIVSNSVPTHIQHSYYKKYPNVKINFLGNKRQNEIYNLLKKSHIFCLPVYSEALGVAIMEALTFEIPVITTKVGGIPELFGGIDYPYFIKTGDIKELSEKIKSIESDFLMAKMKVVKVKKHLIENFSINNSVTRLITIVGRNEN